MRLSGVKNGLKIGVGKRATFLLAATKKKKWVEAITESFSEATGSKVSPPQLDLYFAPPPQRIYQYTLNSHGCCCSPQAHPQSTFRKAEFFE